MPRSLKIMVSCDGCGFPIEDEDHEGSLVLSINGEGPRQMDVCAGCRTRDLSIDSLLSRFNQADDLPIEPKKKRDSQGEYDCPIPGCDVTSPTTQGRGRHMRAAHDTSMRDWSREHG